MRLKEMHLRAFKRFSDTHIQGLPASARLIVLAGPNGSGKSSIFDGLKTWHSLNGGQGGWDETYGAKVGEPSMQWTEHVRLEFHEPLPGGADERKKLIYVRSAFRHEAEFNLTSLNRSGSPLDNPRVNRMIDIDQAVSDNYQRLVMATISGIFSSEIPDSATKGEVRDLIIGDVRRALSRVYSDLVLEGVGEVLADTGGAGTFYFSKGTASNFVYKNLSAGEKAAFDLILDAVVKRRYFDNSVWCIDEPESHLNSRVQAKLLSTLMELMPPDSQMVLASHSIGFMREGWEMAKKDPTSVAFLDLQDLDFDQPQILEPTKPSRTFWSRLLMSLSAM